MYTPGKHSVSLQNAWRQIGRNPPYPHFPLPVHCFVRYSIVFFYICLNLFSRCLWIEAAFSPVRFNVRGINRSDIQHFARIFSLSA
ncbi:hypothetical protein BK796_04145 [Kosakonia pseudosacchari]|uniref:Uncharacterized protein n=1 Tax=Kosakonia pseudosacchari TaxID=1646340 RepID=A0ABX4ITB4_9ENTR|nr:hypothetical protein BK796_04145 [Kosakonia pseudosacchari]